MNHTHILNDISQERARQENLRLLGKFAATCATRGPREMSNAECFAVLGEEVGEVARDVLEGDRRHLRIELIQVAAVCVAWVERLDAQEVPE